MRILICEVVIRVCSLSYLESIICLCVFSFFTVILYGRRLYCQTSTRSSSRNNKVDILTRSTHINLLFYEL